MSASTPARAAPMLSPDVSRSLVHRWPSSRSQGWAIRSNRSRARGQGQPGRGGDARELVQPPHVPGVLDLPASPVPQRLQRITGIKEEQGRLAGLDTGFPAPLLF